MLVSCEMTTLTPTDQKPGTYPTAEKVILFEPRTSISENNSDPNASMMKYNVESIHGLFTYLTVYNFYAYSWQKSENVFSTTLISMGNFTTKLEVIEDGSTYTFKEIWNGTLDNVTYNYFVVMEGVVAKNGSNGIYKSNKLADNNLPFIYCQYSWNRTITNIVDATTTYYSQLSEMEYKYELTLNADKSGRFLLKYPTYTYYESEWTNNGSGWVKYYDTSGGLTDNFVWTANP